MRNIVFTIKTAYSEESFFTGVNENRSIELQMDDALADICFCDAYEIVSYMEVNQDYVEKRNILISEYENLFGETVEEAFCSGKYTTLEAIENSISIGRRLKKNETIY